MGATFMVWLYVISLILYPLSVYWRKFGEFGRTFDISRVELIVGIVVAITPMVNTTVAVVNAMIGFIEYVDRTKWLKKPIIRFTGDK